MRRWWLLLCLAGCREAPPDLERGVTVAAVQGPMRDREGCDEVCTLEGLVRDAAKAGAQIVVTPEYALNTSAEVLGPVGEVPSKDAAPLQKRFGQLSDELNLLLFLQLITIEGETLRNTLVAFDDGRLVGAHHKFELYGEENGAMAAGEEPTVVSTRFGRVGMLICADLYGPPAYHAATAEADMVVVSAQWTVAGAARWPAAFAHDWNVPVVASNGSGGKAAGGGIFDRHGRSRGGRLASSPIDLSRLELP